MISLNKLPWKHVQEKPKLLTHQKLGCLIECIDWSCRINTKAQPNATDHDRFAKMNGYAYQHLLKYPFKAVMIMHDHGKTAKRLAKPIKIFPRVLPSLSGLLSNLPSLSKRKLPGKKFKVQKFSKIIVTS